MGLRTRGNRVYCLRTRFHTCLEITLFIDLKMGINMFGSQEIVGIETSVKNKECITSDDFGLLRLSVPTPSI